MDLNNNNVRRLKELILFTVLLFLGIQNLNVLLDIFRRVLQLIFPFVLGACIAFIINVPMRALEKRFKLKRILSLLLTMICFIGVLVIVSVLVIPELGNTLVTLRYGVPSFLERVELWAIKLFEENTQIVDWISGLEFKWEEIGEAVFNFFRKGAGDFLSTTVVAAMTFVNGIVTFFVALIFSFYILHQKEKLGSQVSKILFAYLPDHRADRIISIAALTSKTFSSFLSGQCMEAMILGLMFFLAMTVFRFPYAVMISVLVAFTALIPIFGAFIGGFIGTFLIFMGDPLQALWFVILFNVLQQLEGNLIYPHVVGNSVGLPSMWVLVAVTLGGSTMGVAGMLIFIPMLSVIYALLREDVYKRLNKKKERKQKPRGG